MTEPSFTPAPEEISGILRRAHRRRTRTAAGGAAALSLALVGLVAVTTDRLDRRASVEITDPGPDETPSPDTSDGADASPAPRDGAGAAGGSQQPAGPRPSSTAGGRDAGSGSAAPAPADPSASTAEDGNDRVDYDGDLGPTRETGAANVQCQSRVIDPAEPEQTVIRNGYCLNTELATSPDEPIVATLRICRTTDSTSDGRLEFPSEEEADFGLYTGHRSGGRVVRDRKLFRFSEQVRYDDAPHAVPVTRGDCLRWRLTMERPEGHSGGLVVAFATTSTTFPSDVRESDMYLGPGE
jgi:hypothetical protein